MTNSITNCDFLIIGAGIIGINIALILRKKYPSASITLIEKEKTAGLHASGRNSGVLHAGFYYSKDSLKAKFSKAGNKAWTEFCIERKLPINQCGKLVVAKNEHEIPGLNELFERSKLNDINLHYITEKEAKEIEPRVKTYQHALFSPTTSSVDPKSIIQYLIEDMKKKNISLCFDERFIKHKKNNHIITNKSQYHAGYVINTAGLYADKIAKQFNFAQHYEILPFKGLYLYGSLNAEKFRTHIYPVPNLNQPFLGVHFTLSVYDDVKIGPTAIPAFWREHYDGVENFKLSEAKDILWRQLGLLIHSNFNFRQLAVEEIKKYNQSYLVTQATALADNVKVSDYTRWGKPGIRAQLIDIKNKKLEMDFVVEHDKHSLHVLNAVSPAFTCAIPFAEHVVGLISA